MRGGAIDEGHGGGGGVAIVCKIDAKRMHVEWATGFQMIGGAISAKGPQQQWQKAQIRE